MLQRRRELVAVFVTAVSRFLFIIVKKVLFKTVLCIAVSFHCAFHARYPTESLLCRWKADRSNQVVAQSGCPNKSVKSLLPFPSSFVRTERALKGQTPLYLPMLLEIYISKGFWNWLTVCVLLIAPVPACVCSGIRSWRIAVWEAAITFVVWANRCRNQLKKISGLANARRRGFSGFPSTKLRKHWPCWSLCIATWCSHQGAADIDSRYGFIDTVFVLRPN